MTGKVKRIGIIGGGASGMTAAIAAARADRDADVFILECNETLGRKILATGNGRCNLTNEVMSPEAFRSENPGFVKEILAQFDKDCTLAFFESLGLVTKSRGGYYYPRCDQASSVLGLLIRELERLSVKVYTKAHVCEIRGADGTFTLFTLEGTYEADKVILSTGSRASAIPGSDGSGYALARSMGHTLVPVLPALVQLRVVSNPFASAAGVRTDAAVTALIHRKAVASDTGELQMTAYGISGIPVFQISRFIARGLYEAQDAQVQIDFLPDLTGKEAKALFVRLFAQNQEIPVSESLTGVFQRKLIPCLLKLAGIEKQTPAGKITDKQTDQLISLCKCACLSIEDTNGFENAQVCSGGVRTQEIDGSTMESNCVKGLYITGELLDADGICGGFNLSWAWATGYIAGLNAAENP